MDKTEKINNIVFFVFLIVLICVLTIFTISMIEVWREINAPKSEKIAKSYQLVNLKSTDKQILNVNSKENSLIGQFFIGSNSTQSTSSESKLNVKYVIQTENGMQLKDFEKEFDTPISDDKVYFKELKTGNPRLEVYGVFAGSSKIPRRIVKYVFVLPKSDIKEIMEKF